MSIHPVMQRLADKLKRTDLPEIVPGDQVRVQVKIKEGDFEGAIRKICEEAAQKKIEHLRSIRLKVGLGLGMDEESVRLHFEALSEGTALEGAAIEVSFVAVKLKCPACGNLFERPKKSLECPQCHVLGVATDIGREFIVESIE